MRAYRLFNREIAIWYHKLLVSQCPGTYTTRNATSINIPCRDGNKLMAIQAIKILEISAKTLISRFPQSVLFIFLINHLLNLELSTLFIKTWLEHKIKIFRLQTCMSWFKVDIGKVFWTDMIYCNNAQIYYNDVTWASCLLFQLIGKSAGRVLSKQCLCRDAWNELSQVNRD